ncbi:MAG: hypothetical protein D4S01_07375 [Dehalococcoidia bacterium]|nr:MAG: hypothetical protein D4S01_07375 [Dehalococcoidia bacterium]
MQQRATKDQQHEREEPPISAGELPCTANISVKPYRCTRCGKEALTSTNHWGHIYSSCNACGNRELECMEPVPEGYGIPPRWKLATLGDIMR